MFEATESNYFRPRFPIIPRRCVSTKEPDNRSLHFWSSPGGDRISITSIPMATKGFSPKRGRSGPGETLPEKPQRPAPVRGKLIFFGERRTGDVAVHGEQSGAKLSVQTEGGGRRWRTSADHGPSTTASNHFHGNFGPRTGRHNAARFTNGK